MCEIVRFGMWTNNEDAFVLLKMMDIIPRRHTLDTYHCVTERDPAQVRPRQHLRGRTVATDTPKYDIE